MAPKTGTPHLQGVYYFFLFSIFDFLLGFFSLLKKSRTTTLQKVFTDLGINLALIHAKGSPQQNLDYCSKADDNFWQHGDIKKASQGSRTDLEAPIDFIVKTPTCTDLDLAENFPVAYVKFNRGLKDFKNTLKRKHERLDRDITVSIFYGEGGTGKTSFAITLCKRLGISYYILSPPDDRNVWWQDYDGEKAIILDDFYGWIKPHVLYRVCDRNPLKLNQKGTSAMADYDYVFITSNKHPKDWYKPEVFARLDETAYFRRFHNIYYFQYYNSAKTCCAPLEKEKDERPFPKSQGTQGAYQQPPNGDSFKLQRLELTKFCF